LTAIDAVEAVAATVATRGLQTFTTEVTAVVLPEKRGDHEVARPQAGYLGTDVLHDADELMAHLTTLVSRRHRVVGILVCSGDVVVDRLDVGRGHGEVVVDLGDECWDGD